MNGSFVALWQNNTSKSQCCVCKSRIRNRQRNHRLRATKTKRYDELKVLDKDISSALYKLAFNTYEGF